MIDVVDDRPWTRPPLAPGPVDREYFEAAGKGRLIVQRCTQCDHHQFPPRGLCVACSGELAWTDVEGVGTVHTFTVLRRHGVEPFASMVPLPLAMIDLPEGVRLMGNILGVDPDTVVVGMKVQAYATRIDDELALPLWRPAEQ